MAERRGHQRNRGIAVREAAFLLLGAVVNVAVAWGFAWFAEGDWSGETSYGITLSERRATEISLLDNVAVSWMILSETQRRAPNHRSSNHGDLIGKAVADAVRHQPRAKDVRPDWGHVVQATNEFDELCRTYPRRWRRVHRGLCVKCAYPVGASDVCTECGEAVRTNGAA